MATKQKIAPKALSKKALLLAERIKKDNAAYEAMTSMERRVAVAKEVRLMLKKGTFLAGSGYGTVNSVGGYSPDLPMLNKSEPYYSRAKFPLGDLQPIIRAGGFECVGCAKAAIIVARAAVGNEVHITRKSFDGDYSAQPLAARISKEVFGDQCADLIECLYEDWSYENIIWKEQFKSKDPLKGDAAKIKAYETYKASLPNRYDTSQERMDAIYADIVKNKGYLVIGKYKF